MFRLLLQIIYIICLYILGKIRTENFADICTYYVQVFFPDFVIFTDDLASTVIVVTLNASFGSLQGTRASFFLLLLCFGELLPTAKTPQYLHYLPNSNHNCKQGSNPIPEQYPYLLRSAFLLNFTAPNKLLIVYLNLKQ